MKKLILCLLVLSGCACILAQEDIYPQEEQANALILEQLRLERSELAVLETELVYFHGLVQQKAVIRELYNNGKISEIALEFKNNDQYSDAAGFLQLIISKPKKSEFYTYEIL
jgi:hypothetical protein